MNCEFMYVFYASEIEIIDLTWNIDKSNHLDLLTNFNLQIKISFNLMMVKWPIEMKKFSERKYVIWLHSSYHIVVSA